MADWEWKMRVESRLCLSWFKQCFGSMPGDSISPNYSKTARCLFYSINIMLVSDARLDSSPHSMGNTCLPCARPSERPDWGAGGTPEAMVSGRRLLSKMLISPCCLPSWGANICLPFPFLAPLPVEDESLRKSFIQSTSREYLCKDCSSHP